MPVARAIKRLDQAVRLTSMGVVCTCVWIYTRTFFSSIVIKLALVPPLCCPLGNTYDGVLRITDTVFLFLFGTFADTTGVPKMLTTRCLSVNKKGLAKLLWLTLASAESAPFPQTIRQR